MASIPTNSSGLPSPASQKERTVFFRLVKKGAGELSGPSIPKGLGELNGHTLSINPEELTVTQPSRVSVQQTLGAAWVDSFGPGLRTINISGTTGWRAKHAGGRDWEEELKSLHNEAFKLWHQEREARAKDGLDPEDVQLEFVDTLDGIAVYVVPQQFVLKRSKSRPLLVQCNIGMMATADIGYSFPVQEVGLDAKAALDSFDQTVADMEKMAAAITAAVTSALQAVTKLLNKINKMMAAAQNIMKAGGSIISAISSIIKKVAQALNNFFAMLAALRNFPGKLTSMWKQAMGLFRNLQCLFKNGFKDAWKLEKYDDFNGAANCSSTNGGSPLSPLHNVNGLTLLPYPKPPRIARPHKVQEPYPKPRKPLLATPLVF